MVLSARTSIAKPSRSAAIATKRRKSRPRKPSSARSTRHLPSIEWRIAGNNPFAMIQRWRIADTVDRTIGGGGGGPDAKPLLVVSRLPPGAVCPVAYVDAAANPNADELARQAADQVARDFKCGTDEAKVLGAPGRAAELTKQR